MKWLIYPALWAACIAFLGIVAKVFWLIFLIGWGIL